MLIFGVQRIRVCKSNEVEWNMLYGTFQATSFKIPGNIIGTFQGSVSAKSFGPICA